MRNIFLVLVGFCLSTIGFSQELTLQNYFSEGILKITPVKDADEQLKGYFIVYQTEAITNDDITLQYHYTDAHLKEITKGTFTEKKNKIAKNYNDLYITTYFTNNQIFIGIMDKEEDAKSSFRYIFPKAFVYAFNPIGSTMMPSRMDYKGFLRYRILDLSTQKLSDSFIIKNDSYVKNSNMEKVSRFSDNQSEFIYNTNYNHFFIMNSLEDDDKKVEDKQIIQFQNSGEVQWNNKYYTENNKDNQTILSYIADDESTLIFFERNKKAVYYNPYFGLRLISSKDGKLQHKLMFPHLDKYNYKVVKCFLTESEITIYGVYSNANNLGILTEDYTFGMYKLSFNRESGIVTSQVFYNWKKLATHFEITDFGEIRKKGFIYIHDFVQLSNGNILAVAENYYTREVFTTDMLFFEFGKNLEYKQHFVAEKFKNKFPVMSDTNYMEKMGLFDYIDFVKHDSDSYSFYFYDNEKKTKKKRSATQYGVVQYQNGTFSRSKISLHANDDATLLAYPSDLGKVLIQKQENDSKPILFIQNTN